MYWYRHHRTNPHQKLKKTVVTNTVRTKLCFFTVYGNFVFPVKRKPGRKKRRQENVTSCEKCNVSFAKLLKRKVGTLICVVLKASVILFSISVIIVEQFIVGHAPSE